MRGFVTVACGEDEYYSMACNLLKSYKYHNPDGAPFAIICDRENSYSKQFDKTIIIQDPTRSYLDKIKMLSLPPYDENIFIDADCLCYRNIQDFWNDMPEKGTACYGKTLDENSDEGWFRKDDLEEKYKQRVSYSVSMHSGIVFFRNDETTKAIYSDCLDIIENYHNNKFTIFKQPADEPVLALSMAMNECRPIENEVNSFLFYPMAKQFKSNIAKGKLSYTKDGGNQIDNVGLLHWQNINVKQARYQSEIVRLSDEPLFSKTYKIIKLFLCEFVSLCKNEYIPWIGYEIDTKILRKKK